MSAPTTLIPVLEIGGSHVTAALIAVGGDDAVAVRETHRDPLVPSESADEIIARIVMCATKLDAPLRARWGVAIPGPFDYEQGIGRFQDVAKFDLLNGVNVRDLLMAALTPAPDDVRFINDADAFLRGEWLAGAGRGHDRVMGITLGTGIGSSFIAGGNVIADGPDVPPLGSVHLLKIGDVPLEEVISTRAIERAYAQAGSAVGTEVRLICGRARLGDPVAKAVLDEAFLQLGRALAPWIRRFRPSVLVIGGSIARSWDVVAPPLTAGIGDPSVGLRAAERGDDAPLLGAAWHATDHFERRSPATGRGSRRD